MLGVILTARNDMFTDTSEGCVNGAWMFRTRDCLEESRHFQFSTKFALR